MALQSSGSISLSQINTELGRASNAQIGVNLAENGSYAAINRCSQYRPQAPNPAKFSEWYRYDHSKTCTSCWSGANELTHSYSCTAGAPITGYDNRFNPVFTATAIGNFNIKIWIDSISSGTLNITASAFALDANQQNPVYLGEYNLTNAGTGSYTSQSIGTTTSTNGFIVCYISIGGYSNQTVSGQIRFSCTCPTTAACGSGNAITVTQQDCFCTNLIYAPDFEAGSYTFYGTSAWFEVGTSNRSVTVTYSVTNPAQGSALAYLYVIDGANNTIVNGVNVTFGTNQTYTFSFTYNGSAYIRTEIRLNCWC